MKSLKKIFITLAIISMVSFSGLHSFADTGVVDLDKVINNYSKYLDFAADMKVKQADVEKFVADTNIQLKDAKTPLEKKNLEEKATKDYEDRIQSIKENQIKQLKEIEDNVYSVIEKTSKCKKIDMVFNKSSVLYGGVDLTDEVIATLNKK